MEATQTQTSWRSLGELFVERGLISEADLERALAEQVATKRRLADILVRRGLVTGHDISNALMEQLGTGTTAQAAPKATGPAAATAAATAPAVAATPAPAPAPKKRPVEVVPMPQPQPAVDPEPADVPEPAPAAEKKAEPKPEPKPAAKKKAKPAETPVSQPSYDLSISAHALIAGADSRRRGAEAELIAGREAHAQVLRGLEQVRAELEARDLSTDSLAREVEQTQMRLRAREEELANEVEIWEDARREAERCGGQLAELQARLEEKERELSEASASATAWAARTAELDSETETLSGRVADALQTLETLAATRFTNGADLSRRSGTAKTQPRKRTPQTGALYFVPKAEGYDLIERDGDLPAVGEALDFGDEQFVVTKIGRSPLPFDRRSCVFLTAV
jgi:hypothetical protein